MNFCFFHTSACLGRKLPPGRGAEKGEKEIFDKTRVEMSHS